MIYDRHKIIQLENGQFRIAMRYGFYGSLDQCKKAIDRIRNGRPFNPSPIEILEIEQRQNLKIN